MTNGSGYIHRKLEPIARDALKSARVVALLGPRQSGKSTLAKRLIGDNPKSYVTFDDEIPRLAALEDPAGFLANRETPLVLDEIQRVPELMLAIKSKVDTDTSPGQYIVTGSANLQALDSIPDALPGRVDYLELWPFSEAELSKSKHASFIDALFDGNPPTITDAPIGRAHYAPMIVRGGYPEALQRSGSARTRFLSGIIRATLTAGAARPETTADVTRRVFEVAAASPAALLNYTGLSRQVGVSDQTIRAHINVLEELFMVRRHSAWLTNENQRLVKSPKLYVTDTGVLCSTLRYNEQRLIEDGNTAGHIFEVFVAMELVKQTAWDPYGLRILHMRADDEHEVDIVLERGDGSIVGIEVKSSVGLKRSALRGLKHLQQIAGDRFQAGYILHCGKSTEQLTDKIWSLPICAMWG